MIEGVIAAVYHLSYRHEGIAAVFERGDDYGQAFGCVQTVVVHEHYAARAHAADDAHGYVACRKVLPVEAVYIPLDGKVALALRGLDEQVVIVAVGRAEQFDGLARDRSYSRRRRPELRTHLLCAQAGHIRVRCRMGADLVPGCRDLADKIGIFFSPELHHEPRCGDVFPFERLQDGIGMFGAPGAVERQRHHLLFGAHRVYGQLCRRLAEPHGVSPRIVCRQRQRGDDHRRYEADDDAPDLYCVCQCCTPMI